MDSVKNTLRLLYLCLKIYVGQECIPGGCVPSATVAVCPGGVCSGGCLVRGVSALGGGCPSMHWGRPPPVNRMTDRCKNITFATSLRMVKRDQLVISTAKRCTGAALGDESEESIVHSRQRQQSNIKTQDWHQQKSNSWQNNGINGPMKRTNALHIFHRKDNNVLNQIANWQSLIVSCRNSSL